jgi:hypothetical protein
MERSFFAHGIHPTLLAALLAAGGCSDNGNLLGHGQDLSQTEDGDGQDDGGDGDGDGDGCLDQGGCEDAGTPPTGDLSACTDLDVSTLAEADVDQLLDWRQQVSDSLAQWQSTPAADRDYKYQRNWTSWAGGGCTVTIEVADGAVVARSQKSWGVDDMGNTVPGEEWTETGADVGSHQGACAEPLLLEDLYGICLSDTLCQDPASNSIQVALDKDDGLLRTCSYFPQDCEDDCLEGVWLEILE